MIRILMINGIPMLDYFLRDLKKCVNKKQGAVFHAAFRERCKELADTWPNQSERTGWLELLKHIRNPQLWHMRFDHVWGMPNIRILYAEYQGAPIILGAYLEEQGKDTANHYAKITAQNRYKELMEYGAKQ